MYTKLQSSHLSYLRQLFAIQHPRSTRSSSALTLLRNFCHLVAQICWTLYSYSCLASLEQTPTSNYLTHPTNSPKPHPLLSFHSSFTPNLKHCSSTNAILIHPLLPTSLPVSTPNNIHHSRLTVYLPDSLDLTWCLSILFWTIACEQAGSRDFAFVGPVEIPSLRLRSLARTPDFKCSWILGCFTPCGKNEVSWKLSPRVFPCSKWPINTLCQNVVQFINIHWSHRFTRFHISSEIWKKINKGQEKNCNKLYSTANCQTKL